MRVDIHAHYWSGEYLSLLNKLGRTDINPKIAHPSDFSTRLESMDEAQIDCQVLAAIGLDTQLYEENAATEAACFINDKYREVMNEHRGRFQAFGWVPLPYVDAAIKEAERCLDDLKFAGIGMACTYQDRTLDDKEFEPFWDVLNNKKAVVFVHPAGQHSCGHVGFNNYNLDIILGSPAQMSMTAMRLVFSGITLRYPDIRFVMASCCGTLPYIFPQIKDVLNTGFNSSFFYPWVKETGLNPADPMEEFKKLYYDTCTHNIPSTMLAIKESVGADRLVYGSDALFGSPIKVIEYIESSTYLTGDEKNKIVNHSSQNLLQLDKAGIPIR